MIVFPYLALAVIRFFISPLDRSHRGLLLLYRFGIAFFAIALASVVLFMFQMLWVWWFHQAGNEGAKTTLDAVHRQQYTLIMRWAAIPAQLVAVSIGEHLVFNDLQRRGILPAHAARLPLSV